LKVCKIPEIDALVRYIWNQRAQNNDVECFWNLIQNTAEYNACVNRFVFWEFIIIEATKKMLCDLKTFEEHDYKVNEVENMIGYISLDVKINYTEVHGYKTMFAYFKANEEKKISDEGLKKNIYVLVHAGSFSYAEIPRLYQSVLGATGTLKTLSSEEKKLLKTEYKIDKSTFMPSVFQSKIPFNLNDPSRGRIKLFCNYSKRD
jgi:hypothetical protein